MDLNPIADMVEKAKQQHFDDKLEKLHTEFVALKEAFMDKQDFITLEVFQTRDNRRITEKVSINPKYICFVKDDGDNAYVCINDGSMLHTLESRAQILKLIEGESPKQVIG